jgi:hypothetical protein
MTWEALFEQAATYEVDLQTVRETLAERRHE